MLTWCFGILSLVCCFEYGFHKLVHRYVIVIVNKIFWDVFVCDIRELGPSSFFEVLMFKTGDAFYLHFRLTFKINVQWPQPAVVSPKLGKVLANSLLGRWSLELKRWPAKDKKLGVLCRKVRFELSRNSSVVHPAAFNPVSPSGLSEHWSLLQLLCYDDALVVLCHAGWVYYLAGYTTQ